MKSLACAVNIIRPLGTISRKLAAVHGSTCLASRFAGIVPENPSRRRSSTAIEPNSNADADDVDDLDARIEPQPLAHRLRRGPSLERAERAPTRGHLSSTVLPLTMMRSARISSGLSRFG